METLKFLMTTTFYPPYHIGGDAIHVKYLADELVKRGHEVDVLHSLDAYKSKKKILPVKGEQDQIHTHNVKEHFNLSSYVAYVFGNSASINRKFDELLCKIHPDVVHHHNISLLGYGILKKRGNYVNLLTAHDYWLACQRHSLLRNGLEICEGGSCFSCALKSGKPPQTWRFSNSFKTSIESVDILLCPSTFVQRQLARKTGVKSITLQNFAPFPPTDIPRVDYLDYFLFVGALEKGKGVLELLELFKQLGPAIGIKLVMVGDGSLRNRVVEFIRTNLLSSYVHYMGPIADRQKLYSLYKNAKAAVIPSTCLENAPLVALEAFSVGCPVIASNIGGLPEIVGKLDKRLIFSSWIELKNIILNFSRKEFPSEKIEEIYNGNFSPEVYVDKYLAMIHAEHHILNTV